MQTSQMRLSRAYLSKSQTTRVSNISTVINSDKTHSQSVHSPNRNLQSTTQPSSTLQNPRMQAGWHLLALPEPPPIPQPDPTSLYVKNLMKYIFSAKFLSVNIKVVSELRTHRSIIFKIFYTKIIIGKVKFLKKFSVSSFH